MTTPFEKPLEEVSALSKQEKASPTHARIEQLKDFDDADIKRMWIEEAHQRYEAYRKGEVEAVDSDEAIRRIRDRLKGG